MNIGIIHCPKHAGFTSVSKRWQKIADALQAEGIEYDLVQSEDAKSVKRLVSMMIRNGYKTIIIAGGDGALNDAVNCLMKEERAVRESITLGVIPNGRMNDFASFWGFKDDDLGTVAASIKAGRTRRIDVGTVVYTDKEGQKNIHYFLNCINVGLIASIQDLRMKTRKIFWSRKASYVISLLMLLFQRMVFKMKYTINDITEQRNVMSMCIGSALGYGQTPNAVPYNGFLDVTVITNPAFTQIFAGICLFLRGKILNHKGIRPYRCREVELEVTKGTKVSVDDRTINLSSYNTFMEIGIELEAINFLIEK